MAGRAPNIIFILADDLGWGDAAYHGHPHVQTPHIDALAAAGLRVENFYVNGPVCSPSRVAFTTGRYPAREGFNHITSSLQVNGLRLIPDWLDPDRTTIADIFKAAGYNTAHYGKWHMGKYGDAPEPGEYGFDHYNTADGPGISLLKRYGVEDSSPAILDNLTFDAAIEFIRENAGTPFYLNVWTPLPHAPLEYSEAEQSAYAGLVPDSGDPGFAPWLGEYIAAAKNPAGQMQMYLTAVSQIDTNVGRLLQELESLGLAEDTIILFTSDNGPEDYHIGNAGNAGMGSPGPFRGRKRSLYEGGIREPFIIKWPGVVPQGSVDTQSVLSGIDLLPSLVSLAGLSPADLPPNIEGEDLSSVFIGQPAGRQNPLFWEWFWEVSGDAAYLAPTLAVRAGKWKLFSDYAGSPVELYDLEADPSELTNLAGEHPETVDRLLPLLQKWAGTLPRNRLRDAVKQGADRSKLMDLTPYLGAVSYEFAGGNPGPSRPGYSGVTGQPLEPVGVASTGISSNSPSAGYALASGGENYYSSEPAPAGGVEIPYYAFLLLPDPGFAVALNGISFGARTLVYPQLDPGPGPTHYQIRSSLDDFQSIVAEGAFTLSIGDNNYWHHYELNDLDLQGGVNVPLEIRFYWIGASAGFRGGAFRIDDVRFNAHGISGSLLQAVLVPIQIGLAGGKARVSFQSVSAIQYQLQVSRNTTDGWATSGNPFEGDGSLVTLIPPGFHQIAGAVVFYRLLMND